MTDGLKHHFAAENQFHWLAQVARRGSSERTLSPWPQFAAKARADKLGNHSYVLLRQAEHLREDAAVVDDPCDDSYSVRFEPSQIAVVTCGSSGLCVSAGVTYVWSSLVGALANAFSESPR